MHLASVYLGNLKEDFVKPVVIDGLADVYHIFNIRCEKRDALKHYLSEKEIKTEIHYPVPPYRQQALKGLFGMDYPVSETIHNTTLSLPISFCHTEAEIRKTIRALNDFR